jgi:hypothetical protein
MVLVVTGTPPKTANGAEAAMIPGVTAGHEVGSVATKRRSASAKALVDAVVCAAMAFDNCPNDARRLAMSSLVAAGGVDMLSSEHSGHDKSRSRQMRLLRS